MLAEHFIGSMDNGADFTSGWDKPNWEWENVVMLSNRKAQAGDWTEEPLLVTPASSVSSGIPGVSASSGSGAIHKSFSDRNSSYPDGKLVPGFSPSPVKHEKVTPAEIAKSPGLSLEARSEGEHKVNEKISNSGASHQKDFLLGLGGGAAHNNKGEQSGAGDAETGLKLGLKRSFTPDSTPPSTSTNTNTNTNTTATATTTTTNNNNKSSPGKKPRGSANHVPRCQVEGCKTDLSSAKDYHRRHKVCAMHSKSAKVSVNGTEQRFCQQCSRFHVLAEFDEGKRSCRRRLAGHNERRRKPQPDPMALTSAALAPYQAGFMRLARDDRLFGYGTPLSYLGLDNLHGKVNWPRFGNIDEHAGLLSASSTLCRPERFFMLFPQRKAPGVNGIGMQASGAMGQNLSLSSSSPGPGGYTGLGPPPHGVTGISDPGRALSLLSSQSWAASSHDSMEQLMSEKQRASSYSQTGYGSGAASQPPASLALVPMESTSQGSYMPSLGVNNYENNSVLTLLQESEFRALPDQHARPTIDLMQMSTQSPQAPVVMQQPGQVSSNTSNGNNNSSNGNNNATSNSGEHLADFQVLKPYSSTTIYDPHQL